MLDSTMELDMNKLPIEEILRIANADASKAYRSNLTEFSVRICLMDDGWHVEFEMIDKGVNGGAPRYIICPETGEITWKIYEQ